MSDLRVDTKAIEHKYGLHGPGHQVWSVTPVWTPQAPKGKQVVTLDNAGAAADIVSGIIRIFEARTMAQHRQAVEVVERDLLWDGPPIRLSNKGHLRLAAYLFKYFAHLRIIPFAAILSEPTPGCHLIELDAVAVSMPHRPWFAPITWLLPAKVAKNVHLKIGVSGPLENGKVELLVGRLTNLPAFLPFAWQRSINGILMGAVPHALENALGFVFDFADGGDYYARKRNELFRKRHPNSTNPTWDWLTDVATDVPQWAMEQGSVAFETAQALTGSTFERISSFVSTIINFYVWLFNTIWGTLNSTFNTVSGTVNQAAGAVSSSYTPQPGTAAASSPRYTGTTAGQDAAKVVKNPAAVQLGGAARRAPVTTRTY